MATLEVCLLALNYTRDCKPMLLSNMNQLRRLYQLALANLDAAQLLNLLITYIYIRWEGLMA